MSRVVFKTKKGVSYQGDSLKLITKKSFLKKYRNKINLIFTSPPFSLTRKKEYGNENGENYIKWLTNYSNPLRDLLAEDGSIVIELGNTFEPGSPTFSTIPFEALLSFKKESGLHLCQEIICHNPGRLPGPAQWVTVDRIRLKDSYTRLWWFSKNPYPKSDNSNVLREYSTVMKRKFKSGNVNTGKRPSGHVITESFLKNNKGSISPSFIELGHNDYIFEGIENSLSISNSNNQKRYNDFCRKYKFSNHPARMQLELPEFFIRFLTNKDDIVFDPFAGSNTTGFVAENLDRKWISCEMNIDYIKGSLVRFHHEVKSKFILERLANKGF